MNWNAELAYDVTPKCGPMRTMRKLRDANYALLDDLTAQCRYQRHWFAVGRLLMAAAESGGRLDVMLATDALVMALEVEGWMSERRDGRTPVRRSAATSSPLRRRTELISCRAAAADFALVSRSPNWVPRIEIHMGILIRGALRCVKCDEIIHVAQVGELPRRFKALCPNCRYKGIYRRDSVRIEALPELAVARTSLKQSENESSVA